MKRKLTLTQCTHIPQISCPSSANCRRWYGMHSIKIRKSFIGYITNWSRAKIGQFHSEILSSHFSANTYSTRCSDYNPSNPGHDSQAHSPIEFDENGAFTFFQKMLQLRNYDAIPRELFKENSINDNQPLLHDADSCSSNRNDKNHEKALENITAPVLPTKMSQNKKIDILERVITKCFEDENEAMHHLKSKGFTRIVYLLRNETSTFMYLFAKYMQSAKEPSQYLQYIKKAASLGHSLSMWEYALHLHRAHLRLLSNITPENQDSVAKVSSSISTLPSVLDETVLPQSPKIQMETIDLLRRDVLRLLHKCSDLQDENAQFLLAEYYIHGWGTPVDIDKGIKYRRFALENGHPGAQLQLALDYLQKHDVHSCLSALVELSQCDPYGKAEATIAKLLQENELVRSIALNADTEALRYLELSHEKGNLLSTYRLAKSIHSYEKDFESVDFSRAIALYKKASSQVKEAALTLGKFYKNGLGILLNVDAEKSWSYMLHAHKLGCNIAGTFVSEYLFDGFGVKKDIGRAENSLQPLLQQNIPRSFYVKYLMTRDKDLKEAIRALNTAAKLGDPEGQYHLACIILKSYIKDTETLEELDIEANPHIAMDLLESSANSNYPPAMNEYGMILLSGNPSLAMKYFEYAAVNGYLPSLTNIGHIYLEENNFEKADYYLQKAIDLCGEVNAMFNLARSLEKQNQPSKALQYLEMACSKDHIHSLLYFGVQHCSKSEIYSKHLNFNEVLGFSLFQRAFDLSTQQGILHQFPDCSYNLGLCHYFGIGIQESKEKGLKFISEACDSHHPFALLFLGWNYKIEGDITKASYWLNEAKEYGVTDDEIKKFFTSPKQYTFIAK